MIQDRIVGLPSETPFTPHYNAEGKIVFMKATMQVSLPGIPTREIRQVTHLSVLPAVNAHRTSNSKSPFGKMDVLSPFGERIDFLIRSKAEECTLFLTIGGDGRWEFPIPDKSQQGQIALFTTKNYIWKFTLSILPPCKSHSELIISLDCEITPST